MPPALDYSQPLETPTDLQAEETDDSVVREAMSHFDAAMAFFKQGKVVEATTAVNRALILLPGDRSMQEFRALCLFARQQYHEAAAVLYAVLADGPGWDWDTMIALYPDVDVYTRQLRALEAYVRENPDDGAAHFLLGYHYAVLDDKDAAAAEFRMAAKLDPQDVLSAQLADALSRQAPAGYDDDQ